MSGKWNTSFPLFQGCENIGKDYFPISRIVEKTGDFHLRYFKDPEQIIRNHSPHTATLGSD